MPMEANVHGDALCFLVMRPLLQTLAVGSWRLVAVGGGWWRLVAVGGGWRLAVGLWRLAVDGPWGLSLRAVLNNNKKLAS